MPPYRFSHDFAKALLKALGLEGHRVRRIELTCDVQEPVQVKVWSFAEYDNWREVVHVLELGDWRADVTSATDTNKRYARPTRVALEHEHKPDDESECDVCVGLWTAEANARAESATTHAMEPGAREAYGGQKSTG
jgi:hypothetical protein